VCERKIILRDATGKGCHFLIELGGLRSDFVCNFVGIHAGQSSTSVWDEVVTRTLVPAVYPQGRGYLVASLLYQRSRLAGRAGQSPALLCPLLIECTSGEATRTPEAHSLRLRRGGDLDDGCRVAAPNADADGGSHGELIA
jgi:hypothetical protein